MKEIDEDGNIIVHREVSSAGLLSRINNLRSSLDKVAYCENEGSPEQGLYWAREIARAALEIDNQILRDNVKSEEPENE